MRISVFYLCELLQQTIGIYPADEIGYDKYDYSWFRRLGPDRKLDE